MVGLRLQSKQLFAVVAAVSCARFALAAWLCDEQATSVATLIEDGSGSDGSFNIIRPAGRVVVEGVYQQSPWKDRFNVEV